MMYLFLWHKTFTRFEESQETVFTKICGYDGLIVSNQKIAVKQQEEEDAMSKECCTATLINSDRNKDTVACVHFGNQNVNDDLHIRPCTTQDINNWSMTTCML